MKKSKGELIHAVVDGLVDGVNEAVDWFNDPHAYGQRLRGYLPQEEWIGYLVMRRKKPSYVG